MWSYMHDKKKKKMQLFWFLPYTPRLANLKCPFFSRHESYSTQQGPHHFTFRIPPNALL